MFLLLLIIFFFIFFIMIFKKKKEYFKNKNNVIDKLIKKNTKDKLKIKQLDEPYLVYYVDYK